MVLKCLNYVLSEIRFALSKNRLLKLTEMLLINLF